MSLASHSIPLTAASGMWQYLPLRDALVVEGWNASYTGSFAWPSSSDSASATGVGSLFFRTQLSGASVGISFVGTNLLLCVTDHGANYHLSLDDVDVELAAVANDPQCASQGAATTLAFAQLESKSHAVTLSLQNATAATEFWFHGGVIGTEIAIKSADDKVAEKMIDDRDSGWVLNRTPGTAWDNGTDVRNYMGTGTFTCIYGTGPNSEATHTFTGASAVALFAPSTRDTFTFSVVLDGQTFSSNNSASGWYIPGTVTFFRAGLDPNKLYTFNFRNWNANYPNCPYEGTKFVHYCCQIIDTIKLFGSAETLIGVTPTRGSLTATSSGSVPTTSQPPREAKASKNVAALTGGIVGGFFGALLIYALVFFFLRRRRQHNAPQMINSPATSRPYSTPYYPMVQTVSSSTSRTLDLDPDVAPTAAARHSGRLHPPPPPGSGMYFPTSSYAATSTTDDSYESEVVLDMGAPMHPTKPQRPSAQLSPLPVGHDRSASSSSSRSKTPLTGSSSEVGTSKSESAPEPRRQDTIDLLVEQLHHRGPMSTPGSTLPPAYRQ